MGGGGDDIKKLDAQFKAAQAATDSSVLSGDSGSWAMPNTTEDRVVDLTSGWAANNGGRELNANATTFWNALSGKDNGSLFGNLNTVSGTAADSQLGEYGKFLKMGADEASKEARQGMEQRLAQGGMLGTASGAANKALMNATYSPYVQMQTELAKTRAGLAQNAFNNTFGATANAAESALVGPQFTIDQGTASENRMLEAAKGK